MSEQKPEENPTQKRLANLRPPFEPGNPGGPGRPKGSRNLSTIIREALAAKAPKDYLEKLTARGIVLQEDTWESVLVAVAIGKAASGSIQHLREILDRTEGKPVQPVRAYNDRAFGKAPQDVNLNADMTSRVVLQFEKKPRQK